MRRTAVITGAASGIGLALARRAAREDMNLVLADIDMKPMDGITLLKGLRALPEFRFTPILILTTESSDAMKAQGKAAGATGWLVKPFDPNRLVDVVRKVIG